MLIIKRPKLPAAENLFVHNWAIHAHEPEEQRAKTIARKLDITVDQVNTWLADPIIQNAILHEIAHDEAEHGVDTPNILRQVSRMTFYDPALIVNSETGEPTPLHRLPEEIRAAIQGVEVTVRQERDGDERIPVVTYKYKFCDRNSSVEKLMRYMGLFDKDNSQKSQVIAEMLDKIYADSSRLPIKPNEVFNLIHPEPAETIEPLVIEGDPAEMKFDNPYK